MGCGATGPVALAAGVAMSPPHPTARAVDPPPMGRGGGAGRQPGAHQVDEVVAVEALLRALGRARHRVLEAADRVAAAFHVRVVRREEANLLADLLDDPADRIDRIRRDADLAPHVLARPER